MRHAWMFTIVVGVLAGCTPEDKPPATAEKASAVKRSIDHTVLARGRYLYLQHPATWLQRDLLYVR